MQLIPGDRICFASRYSNFCLYDTSAIETTTDIPPIDPPTWDLPTWEVDTLPGPLECLSQLYHCRNTNTLRLIFDINHNVLYGIVIPCNPKAIPRLTTHQLMDFGYPRGYCDPMSCGYNTAIRDCSMYYYSWPDGPASPFHFSKSLSAQVYNVKQVEHFAFDEASGRVAVGGHYEIFVSDFAKFQKCF